MVVLKVDDSMGVLVVAIGVLLAPTLGSDELVVPEVPGPFPGRVDDDEAIVVPNVGIIGDSLVEIGRPTVVVAGFSLVEVGDPSYK